MASINVPRFNYLNYGDAVQQGEQIKASRIRNEASALSLDEQKNMITNRDKAQKIREMSDQMPDQIQNLEAQGMFDEADKLRDNYVGMQVNGIKTLTTLRDSINGENYDQFRSDLLRSGAITPEMMPVKYDDGWFKKKIKEEKGKIQTHTRKWGAQGATFSQDFISQDGDIIWEGDKYDANKAKENAKGGVGGSGSKTFSMKPSDSNSIRGAAASLYQGDFDPITGKFSGLNPDITKKVAAVSSEAARIYNENEGRIPHDRAVARAARKIGMKIKDLAPSDGMSKDDPLGLMNMTYPNAQPGDENNASNNFGINRLTGAEP